jgi:hypothetical protein
MLPLKGKNLIVSICCITDSANDRTLEYIKISMNLEDYDIKIHIVKNCVKMRYIFILLL